MTRFSAWSVFWNGLTNQTGWKPQWRNPELKADYDVVIVGGGLHGLATAYYLAKNHGVSNIAVLEKGWVAVMPGVILPLYVPTTSCPATGNSMNDL